MNQELRLGIFLVTFVMAGMAWFAFFFLKLARRDKLGGEATASDWFKWRVLFAVGFLGIVASLLGTGQLLGVFR